MYLGATHQVRAARPCEIKVPATARLDPGVPTPNLTPVLLHPSPSLEHSRRDQPGCWYFLRSMAGPVWSEDPQQVSFCFSPPLLLLSVGGTQQAHADKRAPAKGRVQRAVGPEKQVPYPSPAQEPQVGVCGRQQQPPKAHGRVGLTPQERGSQWHPQMNTRGVHGKGAEQELPEGRPSRQSLSLKLARALHPPLELKTTTWAQPRAQWVLLPAIKNFLSRRVLSTHPAMKCPLWLERDWPESCDP